MAEARIFLIIIHIFTNSHPNPIPNTYKNASLGLSFYKESFYIPFRFFCSFWPKNKFEPWWSYQIVLIRRKECVKKTSFYSEIIQIKTSISLLHAFCFISNTFISNARLNFFSKPISENIDIENWTLKPLSNGCSLPK